MCSEGQTGRIRAGLKLDVVRLRPPKLSHPGTGETVSANALKNARVIITVAHVAHRAGDLGAQAPLNAAAAAPPALAFSELPRRPLTDAIDDAIGVVTPQMDFTC